LLGTAGTKEGHVDVRVVIDNEHGDDEEGSKS